MGLIQKIGNALGFKGKSQQAVPLLSYGGGYRYFFQGLDGFSYNTRNATEFTRNGFGRNPYVFAVVDKIAKTCASFPRMVADDQGERIERGIDDFAGLMISPDQKTPFDDFYYKMIASLLVTGNTFLYQKDSEFFATPGNLNFTLSEYVTINTANGREDGTPVSYNISPYGVFPAKDVLHISFPNIAEATNWGLSPLYSGQPVYTSSNNNFTAKASVLENRGISGILSAKDAQMPMTPKQQEELQKDWQNRTAGADKFGGIHVTTAALDFLDVGMSSKDLELVAHNVELLRDVCRIYGVDPALFGDPSAKTYNNQQEAKQAFILNTCLPLSQKVDKALGQYLLPKFNIGGQYCVDEMGIPVVISAKKKAQTEEKKALTDLIVSQLNAGIITVEEAREKLDV